MSCPQLDDLFQLLVGDIGLDFEIHADSLVSLANVRIEIKESMQIDIAFERRLDFFDLNPPCRCVIDH